MTESVILCKKLPNIEKPRWDQTTYKGRATHFFVITNPLNLFCSDTVLQQSKNTIENYRKNIIDSKLTVDELWRAKHIYDSAFHPDTKDKMLLIGRMSAQVPMNMLITGCMMTFYKSTPAVVFWQWVNQSFNAVVNYTNRSGENPIPIKQLLISYASATGGALVTALSLNSLVKKAPSLVGRLVPFAAVAAANCVNIPLMRSRELKNGISVYDKSGEKVGDSKIAAQRAILMVVISRIAMATPGMVFPPIVMNRLEKKVWFQKRMFLSAPIQVGLVGLFLVFATPMCCAFFPQQSSLSVKHIEKNLADKLSAGTDKVYYNKGL